MKQEHTERKQFRIFKRHINAPGPGRGLGSKLVLTKDLLNRDHVLNLAEKYGSFFFEDNFALETFHISSPEIATFILSHPELFTTIPMVDRGVYLDLMGVPEELKPRERKTTKSEKKFVQIMVKLKDLAAGFASNIEYLFAPERPVVGRNLLDTAASDERHPLYRKHAREVMSGKKIAAAVPEISKIAQDVMNSWQDGDEIEVPKQMSTITARTMSLLIMGDGPDVEHITPEEMDTLFAALREAVKFLKLTVVTGNYDRSKAGTLLVLLGQYQNYLEKCAAIAKVNRGIFERIPRRGDGSDFISIGERLGLTMAEVESQGGSLFQAGFETVQTLLRWMNVRLTLHPEWYDILRKEVLQVFPDGNITVDKLSQLPIMDAFLKETLRLDTPVASIQRYATQDTTIGEYTIPKGSTLTIGLDTMHRLSDHRPNSEVFDPSQQMKGSETKVHVYPFAEFPGNDKSCVGMNLAMVEAKVILATQLYKGILLEMLPAEDAKATAAENKKRNRKNAEVSSVEPIYHSLTKSTDDMVHAPMAAKAVVRYMGNNKTA